MIIDFLISIPLIAIFILVIKLIKTLRSKSSWKNFFDYEMLAVFIMSIFIETIFLGLIHIIFLKTNTIEFLFLILKDLIIIFRNKKYLLFQKEFI